MTDLRPYQQQALDEIRAHYASGIKRVLLHASVGSGKTVVFSEVLKGVIAKGRRAVVIIRGKDLIDQTSQRLFRENVPHGCLQGTHWNRNDNAPVQICSVDTLYRRKIAPKADLVVIDEAQYANSESFLWVIAQYPNAYFLPVSATPHHKKGFRHIADVVVHPISTAELMDQGYLSRPRYFAPTTLDLTTVKIDSSTKDYNVAQAAEVLLGSTIYGDVVSQYKAMSNDRPAICFALNIEHSKILRDRFIAAGVPAVHVEADTSRSDRDDAIARLKSGEIKVICNVGILCVGVDIPFLETVILARPTKSYNLYIQQIGRGSRVTDTKNTFLILDHTNNIHEHGFLENEKPCDLEAEEKKVKEVKERIVTCMNCYGTFAYRFEDGNNCPLCGESCKREREAVESKIKEEEAAVLKELSVKEFATKWQEVLLFIERAVKNRNKCGMVYHLTKDKFGEDYAKSVWRATKKEFHRRTQSASG